jgi:hypothetical protein
VALDAQRLVQQPLRESVGRDAGVAGVLVEQLESGGLEPEGALRGRHW